MKFPASKNECETIEFAFSYPPSAGPNVSRAGNE